MQRGEIVAALTALGERLSERGIDGEVYVFGGAAIVIAFDARRATRDVDAVFEPKREVYAAADEVGDELGLPPGWLNDGVKRGCRTGLGRPARRSRASSWKSCSCRAGFALRSAQATSSARRHRPQAATCGRG
jgi:hypothetical protein